jgi:hypothetical protein
MTPHFLFLFLPVEPSGCKVLELFFGLVAISPRAPDFLAFLCTARRRPLSRLRCLPARLGRHRAGRVCDECLRSLDGLEGQPADAFGCRECCYSCCGDCLKRATAPASPARATAAAAAVPLKPRRGSRALGQSPQHVCLWNTDVPCLAERTLVMQRALANASPMTAARAPVYARLKHAALQHQAWLHAADVDDSRLRQLEALEDRATPATTHPRPPAKPKPDMPFPAAQQLRGSTAPARGAPGADVGGASAGTAVTPTAAAAAAQAAAPALATKAALEADIDSLGLETWLQKRYSSPPPEYIFECHSSGLARQWGVQ